MRTKKDELIGEELKPLVCRIIKENREKYKYSLEDLSRAINNKKNRQTLHKYEIGTLNIPYDIFFEICRVFNVEVDTIEELETTDKNKRELENKMVKNYMNSIRKDKDLKPTEEKIINTYKNAYYEPILNRGELSIKIIDDSMYPSYYKNDKIYFKKQSDYKNGDDIVIAVKNNILSVRKLYRYPKGIILQAINPTYPTINVNIISNDMILGKVTSVYREIK